MGKIGVGEKNNSRRINMAEIYKNATIIAGLDFQIMERATIVVEGCYIAEITSAHIRGGVDLNGALVIPGFIDAHTHIGDRGAKDLAVGLPTEKAVSPPNSLKYQFLNSLSSEELRLMIAEGAREMLASGIVAFADFREGGKKGIDLLRQAVRDLPIRTVVFGEPTVGVEEWEKYLREVEEICAVADGLGIGDITLLTDEQLSALRKVSSACDGRLAVHIAETRQAQQVSKERWGISELIRLLKFSPDLLIHMTNATDADIAEVAASRVPVVCCPRTNCILGDGIPPLYNLWKAGVPLSLGTDNFMFTNPNMFREMDFFSRLMRGQSNAPDAIDPRDVLAAATIGGARALGIDNEYGSLEEGKMASFVVLDMKSPNIWPTHNIYSAIVHRAGPADILFVVACGRELSRGGFSGNDRC